MDEDDITNLASNVVPVLVPAASGVLNLDAEATDALQSHPGNISGESRENKGIQVCIKCSEIF